MAGFSPPCRLFLHRLVCRCTVASNSLFIRTTTEVRGAQQRARSCRKVTRVPRPVSLVTLLPLSETLPALLCVQLTVAVLMDLLDRCIKGRRHLTRAGGAAGARAQTTVEARLPVCLSGSAACRKGLDTTTLHSPSRRPAVCRKVSLAHDPQGWVPTPLLHCQSV